MRNLTYIKFKWLNIIIIIYSISFVGCSSSKDASTNSATNLKSISAQITESTVITFPDKNLEQTIRAEIQCPTGDILKGDVNKITNLQHAEDKNITNLSGIENLDNLASLNLSNNQIKNIEPLKGLTNLTDLNLAANEMINIEPLKELTNLTKLNLAANQMSNIEPLKELTNLTKLNLAANQMSNIEPLKGLTNLTNLDLATNQISNIEPLKGLTNLTNLDLASNQMITMQPLKGLTDLTNLDLAPNQIENYSPVNTYSKTLATTDILNTVIAANPKSLIDSNPVKDNAVTIFPGGNSEKTIRGVVQHPTGDIINGDNEMLPYQQNVEDNHITNLLSTDNLTNLDSNLKNNILPVK